MNAKLFVLGLGLVGLTTVGAGCGSEEETTNTNSANTNAAVVNTNNTNSMNSNEEMEEEEEMMGDTIADLAMDNDDLSTLVAALEAADLVDMFSDEEGSYTVFAPTNDAFAEVQETVDELLLEENVDQLTAVLQYHVVEGAVLSSELEDGQVLTTLNGDTLTVSMDEEGMVMLTDSMGNEVMVTEADMEASNGVVHVVDSVLMPSEEEVAEDAGLEEEVE